MGITYAEQAGFTAHTWLDGAMYSVPQHEILMVMRGHWRLSHEGGCTVLNPGDTCAVPPNLSHAIEPSMSGEASLFRIRNTHDKAGLTGALL